MGLIRDKGDMNGLSITAMASLLGGKHDPAEIRQTLVSLSHDGLLYTSTDDETYMCC